MNERINPWIVDFYASIDRMDTEAFAAYFAESGHFRFANHPPLEGKAAITGGAQGIFGLLKGIRHELVRHWQADGDFLTEGVVNYHRANDDAQMAFPFFAVFEFSEEPMSPISSYRVFVDSHELFLNAGS